MPSVRVGKLRGLVMTALRRSPNMLELPTMAEAGVADFEATSWFGLLAPAGTPKDIVEKLHGETVRTLALPEVRRKFDELGLEPVGNTPAEFAALTRKEIGEWARVIKDAGIKLGN
jgi:tripartite-type tricarboxylate transporter receptor subunit TctC